MAVLRLSRMPWLAALLLGVGCTLSPVEDLPASGEATGGSTHGNGNGNGADGPGAGTGGAGTGGEDQDPGASPSGGMTGSGGAIGHGGAGGLGGEGGLGEEDDDPGAGVVVWGEAGAGGDEG